MYKDSGERQKLVQLLVGRRDEALHRVRERDGLAGGVQLLREQQARVGHLRRRALLRGRQVHRGVGRGEPATVDGAEGNKREPALRGFGVRRQIREKNDNFSIISN